MISTMRSRPVHRHQQKQSGVRGMFCRLSFAVIVLVLCSLSLLSVTKSTKRGVSLSEVMIVFLLFEYFLHVIFLLADFTYLWFAAEIDVDTLWGPAASGGWKPSSAPRSHWPPPPAETNGYLRVRCNGGLNQQRSAICNAVLAARIMNATLVLPELDANSFWHDDGPPEKGKIKKIKAFQLRPDRDAPLSWYTTVALEKMKQHGAIYLTPFSHRMAEEIDNPEYQRLRCRVNYHALRFKPHIMELSNSMVNRLRVQGRFMAIHLRFEMDMLAFAGCFDIFTPEEQKILKKYRDENFAPKKLIYSERRAMGKCPLTPEEVGWILRAMGFDNSTRIYIAAGDLFGGERFMKPFRSLFPHLENHKTVDSTGELATNTNGVLGSAVDYMVCLLSDIFMPTYDGPSNFANNLLGHRLYYGFRTNIQPDRKSLAPIFIDREKGRVAGFEESVRQVMQNTNFGGPHKRISPESFYTNTWPECFCQTPAANLADKCPPDNVVNVLDRQLRTDSVDDTVSFSTNSTSIIVK
ncbi:hypothetical protein F511_00768 [Dorcoceras hygrometricum]|nr:hypothetical protein F511_00768 [Dorcoceras hygrometricum]